MSNVNFAISFSKVDVQDYDTSYWLKIVQEGTSDAATVEDVASVLDSLYSTDPCTATTKDTNTGGNEVTIDNNGEIEPPVNISTFYSIVGDILQFNICKNQDGFRTIQVRIYRSHQEEPYKVIPDNGTITKTVTLTEEIVENATVSNSAGYDLQYSFDSNLFFTWKSCVDENNNPITVPLITLDHSTLKFGINVTALLSLKYVSIYDLIDIKIPNKDDGTMGDCNLLAYYHGMVYNQSLKAPVEDPTMSGLDYANVCTVQEIGDVIWHPRCYQEIEHRLLCACTGDLSDSPTSTYEQVSCPEKLFHDNFDHTLGYKIQIDGYVNCHVDEQQGALNNPDYYKEVCCKSPSVSLPRCPVNRSSVYKGGKGIEGGKDTVLAEYGKDAKLIAVLPKDGICGVNYIVQDIQALDCCDVAPPMSWSGNSVQVISPNSSGLVFVTGGIPSLTQAGLGNYVHPQYKWSITGNGFTINNSSYKTIYTDVPYVRIFLSSGACGWASITVTDGCTMIIGGIRSSLGTWQKIFDWWHDQYHIDFINSIPGKTSGGTSVGSSTGTGITQLSPDNRHWIGFDNTSPGTIESPRYGGCPGDWCISVRAEYPCAATYTVSFPGGFTLPFAKGCNYAYVAGGGYYTNSSGILVAAYVYEWVC